MLNPILALSGTTDEIELVPTGYGTFRIRLAAKILSGAGKQGPPGKDGKQGPPGPRGSPGTNGADGQSFGTGSLIDPVFEGTDGKFYRREVVENSGVFTWSDPVETSGPASGTIFFDEDGLQYVLRVNVVDGVTVWSDPLPAPVFFDADDNQYTGAVHTVDGVKVWGDPEAI